MAAKLGISESVKKDLNYINIPKEMINSNNYPNYTINPETTLSNTLVIKSLNLSILIKKKKTSNTSNKPKNINIVPPELTTILELICYFSNS